jgi:hypothetical protein
MRNHGLGARVGLETDIRNSWWRCVISGLKLNDCGMKALIFQRSKPRNAGRFRWSEKNFQ